MDGEWRSQGSKEDTMRLQECWAYDHERCEGCGKQFEELTLCVKDTDTGELYHDIDCATGARNED